MAERKGTSRREFLKASALAGCGALVASKLDAARLLIGRAEAGELTAAELYELNRLENTLYTVCLNCNTGCGIKVKVLDGVAVKIDGNPYNPWTLTPHLPMTASLATAAKLDGAICPKGQASHQGAYDPYRIRKVMKRAGKRGENKWTSIPFDQALAENGGLATAKSKVLRLPFLFLKCGAERVFPRHSTAVGWPCRLNSSASASRIEASSSTMKTVCLCTSFVMRCSGSCG